MTEKGINPDSDAARSIVYEGIFTRITQTHPLDYYWFWTPEFWTWKGEDKNDVIRTIKDIQIANKAAEKIGASFSTATCGWVLGPKFDRAYFDNTLPKYMPFSVINRHVGFEPVEKSFSKIEGRDKWQISWLEDDPALTSPQLWAGRMRKDAADAYNYRCTGLMGIHWRTKILGPNINALAQAGWAAHTFVNTTDTMQRDLPVTDFYHTWANEEFGTEADKSIAEIFNSIDGGPRYIEGFNEQTAKLFRTSGWEGTGPGIIRRLPQPWESIKKNFDFIEKLESIEHAVTGKGNKERFQYWLNTFKYSRQMALVGCKIHVMDSLVAQIKKLKDRNQQKEFIESKIIPIRKELANDWGQMLTYLLETVYSSGEMGTIANLEQRHIANMKFLNTHDDTLAIIYGKKLPEYAHWKDFRGTDRIIVSAKPTIGIAENDYYLDVLVLSKTEVKNIFVNWKALGKKSKFKRKACSHVARNVYRLTISKEEHLNKDFELFIEANLANNKLIWPTNAPETNHTIVFVDKLILKQN